MNPNHVSLSRGHEGHYERQIYLKFNPNTKIALDNIERVKYVLIPINIHNFF